MQRKVIRLGTATLVASLPSKWTKANALKPGDLLTCQEDGPDLLFSTKKEVRKRHASIHIPTAKDFMGRLIHTPYRFGYDRLDVTYDDPAVVPLIHAFLDELLGFEIVDQTEKGCTIEMVAHEMEDEFDKLLRRSFHIIEGMLADLERAVDPDARNTQKGGRSGDNYPDAKEILIGIVEREKVIDKLTNFCLRVLTTRVSRPGQPDYQMLLVWSLEQMADAIRDISTDLMANPGHDAKTRKALQEAVRKTHQAFAEFVAVYAKPTPAHLLLARNLTRSAKKASVPIEGVWAPLWSLLTTLDHLLLIVP